MNKEETTLIVAALLELSDIAEKVTALEREWIIKVKSLRTKGNYQTTTTLSDISEQLDALHKSLTDFLIQKGAVYGKTSDG